MRHFIAQMPFKALRFNRLKPIRNLFFCRFHCFCIGISYPHQKLFTIQNTPVRYFVAIPGDSLHANPHRVTQKTNLTPYYLRTDAEPVSQFVPGEKFGIDSGKYPEGKTYQLGFSGPRYFATPVSHHRAGLP